MSLARDVRGGTDAGYVGGTPHRPAPLSHTSRARGNPDRGGESPFLRPFPPACAGEGGRGIAGVLQCEALDGLGDARLVVRPGDVVCNGFQVRGSIAHRHANSGQFDHLNIVLAVPNGQHVRG